jgi:hypothetical protein
MHATQPPVTFVQGRQTPFGRAQSSLTGSRPRHPIEQAAYNVCFPSPF